MAINAEVRRKHGAASSHKTHEVTSPADPWDEQEMAAADYYHSSDRQGGRGGLACLCATTGGGIGVGFNGTRTTPPRRRRHLLGSPPRHHHRFQAVRTSSSMTDDNDNTDHDGAENGANATRTTRNNENDDDDDEMCPQCGKSIWPNNSNYYHAGSTSSITEDRRRQFFHSAPSSSDFLFTAGFRRIQRSPTLDDPDHAASLLDATPQLRYLSHESRDMQGEGPLRNVNFLTYLSQAVLDGTSSSSSPTSTSLLSSDHPTSGGNHTHTNTHNTEYSVILDRDRTNNEAAAELASLLWLLAHEMSFEDYGGLESSVFTAVFRLIHSKDSKLDKLAGLAAVTALLPVPSADTERKIIKLANSLSHGLRAANGDFDTMRRCAEALGTLAARTASVDFVEAEITRALEWLQMDRSDRRYVLYCTALAVFLDGGKQNIALLTQYYEFLCLCF
jgi:hypothetical protein